MPLQISRDHFDARNVPVVRWGTDSFITKQRVGNDWPWMPVTEPFAFDFWMCQHGFDQWTGEDTRTRQPVLTAISNPLPAKPAGKATKVFSAPVFSKEFGGERELLITGEAVATAFFELLHTLEDAFGDGGPQQIPILSVQTVPTDAFGLAPKFTVDDFMTRPAKWPASIVTL